MQVGKVSWVGQTFALARCSDSQGKKPRSRKTKEERRKMAESFIKRYRDSNSGNFPSLNLTHKEVGGSFYTVREIVREIIQENKVLRAGSLNSQAFNLDDCPEQHLSEPCSSDSSYDVPLTTDEHASDEGQKKASSGHEISDQDMTSITKEFVFLSQGILVPEVIDGNSYEEQHFMNWHSNGDLENEESVEELVELSGQGQHYSSTQICEKFSVEVKDSRGENHTKCETEDPAEFSQPLPTTLTLGASVDKDMKSDMQLNDIEDTEVIYSSVERVNAFKTGYVCENMENMLSSGHEGSFSNHDGEVDPLQFMDSIVSSSEQMPSERAGILDTSGLTESSVMGSKNISHMPVCSDPTLSSREKLSSTTVDQKAVISVKAAIDLSDCPTQSVKVQVQPPLSSSNDLHMDVVTSISGTAGESGLENCHSGSNAGVMLTSNGTNGEPSEAKERMEDTEDNPILAIIKGLVTAFIKFWTE